jgi:hypothetical protein
LDRVIDAALDRGAEVLWEDAGHRAPMQVTADGVEKLHGRKLGVVEADEAALAPVIVGNSIRLVSGVELGDALGDERCF